MRYSLKNQILADSWEKKNGTLLLQMQMSAALIYKAPIRVLHSTSRPKGIFHIMLFVSSFPYL